MHLDPKTTMYNLPILTVRGYLRQFPGGGDNWQRLTPALEKRGLTSALISKLEEDGYLARPTFKGKVLEGHYLTEKGVRMALASGRVMKRKTAEKMVSELLTRAKVINAREELCYRVRVLVLFGSYLDETREELGDVDVGYALERKYPWGEEQPKEELARIELAHEAGRTFGTFVDRLCWPQTEVLLLLKARKPGLSLHDLSDDAIFRGPHKVVFGALPAK